MSDNDFLRTGTNKSFRMRADVLALMLKGAGYAAIAVLAIWLTFAIFAGLGKLLPEESRDTEDPTPSSFNLTDQVIQQT